MPDEVRVEQRVRQQFSSLFVTLVSVLIGLAFADLVSEANTRMKLWPLDLATALTWAQVIAVATSGSTAWIVYSHIGISRQSIAMLSDTLVAFIVPVPLVLMTAMTGRGTSWPWFYGGGVYLVLSILTSFWQVRLAMQESRLKPFRRLLRPMGFLAVLYSGVPAYIALGWLDQHGLLAPELKLAAAIAPTPMAFICSYMFIRDWRIAVAQASTPAEA